MSLLSSIVTTGPVGHMAMDYWKLQDCMTAQIMSERQWYDF